MCTKLLFLVCNNIYIKQITKFKYIFILLPFIFLGQNNQQINIEDSLQLLIKTANHDTVKAKYLNDLAFELRRNDPEKAVVFAKQALIFNEKYHSKLGENYSLYIIGTAYLNSANYSSAFEYLLKSKNSSEKSGDIKMLGRATNNIGIIYIKQSNLNQALKYYLEALTIRQKLDDKNEMAASYLNIGNVYYKQKNFTQALNFYLKAQSMFNPKKNAFGFANLAHNIGLVFQNKQEFDSALHYFNIGLNMNKEINDQRGITSAYQSIGMLYFNRKDYVEAEFFYNKSLEISRKINDVQSEAETLEALASLKILTGKLKEAEILLKQVKLLLDKNYDLGSYTTYYASLSDLDSLSGNCQGALLNFTKFKNCSDSINERENNQMLIEQQMNFEFSKKENQIKEEQLKKDILAEEKLNNQKVITAFSFAAGILVLILFLISFSAFRVKKRSNQIIITQKELVEKQKLEVEKQKHLVEEKQQSIIDSITYAKRLQQAILPNFSLVNKFFPQNFILYLPKDIVAGDFYWVANYNNKYYLAVCDCTGHGVPGAFMSLLNIGFLSEAIKEKNILSPDLILNYVRERLISSIGNEGRQDGMDGMLFCFDKSENKITYAAAQNKPILINQRGLNILSADKMPVGPGIKTDKFNLYTVNAEKGDMIYFYTDGYADQFGGPAGKKLMTKEMESFLLSIHRQPIEQQKDSLKNKFESWRGVLEQVDDVLIMGIKI